MTYAVIAKKTVDAVTGEQIAKEVIGMATLIIKTHLQMLRSIMTNGQTFVIWQINIINILQLMVAPWIFIFLYVTQYPVNKT